MGDLFAEVYGARKTGGDSNHKTRPLPQDTDLCESTDDSSHTTQTTSEHRNKTSHSDSQRPGNGETHTSRSSERESEKHGHGDTVIESPLQTDEFNNNSITHILSGVTSALGHSDDVPLQRPQPELLDQEATSASCVNSLHREVGDNWDISASDAHHPSADDSVDSTPSVDFNILDDDLDIAVIEHLAAEMRQTTELLTGAVEISSEGCEGCDVSERNGGGHLKDASSTGDVGHREGPLRDVGGGNDAETWSRGEAVVETDGSTVQVCGHFDRRGF